MNRNRAFTLIEMLIVMAIIGLLAAILLPAISAVRKHARMSSARAETRQIASAWVQYYSVYERWPSPALVGDAEAPVLLSGDVARLLTGGERTPDNPKALRFMEFTRLTEEGDPGNPWVGTMDVDGDYHYYVMLDLDYDNWLRKEDSTGGDWPGGEVLTNDVQRRVIVWTVNPDPEIDEDDEDYIVGSWK